MEMLVDTLGFYVFGGADVQVHFKKLNPNYVVKKYDCSLKPLGKQKISTGSACPIQAAFDTLLRNYCHTIHKLTV